MKPDAPTVSVVTTKPTELTVRLTPPAQDGGQPVLKYVVTYRKTASADDPQSKDVPRRQYLLPSHISDSNRTFVSHISDSNRKSINFDDVIFV